MCVHVCIYLYCMLNYVLLFNCVCMCEGNDARCECDMVTIVNKTLLLLTYLSSFVGGNLRSSPFSSGPVTEIITLH